MKPHMRRVLLSVAFVLFASFVGLIALILLFENSFIYFPSKYPEGDWGIENDACSEGVIFPKIEDCHFFAADGIQLHAWYCAPYQVSVGKPIELSAEMVLLWCHGNAGNITYRHDMIRMLMEVPVNIFIFDYRGYGKSEGTPSEQGIYQDARAAWLYLTVDRRISANRIIIFGKSLGGAPAIDLAAHVQCAGLIVQSSFTSASDMARRVMPFIPPFLIRTKMNSIDKIRSVQCPKLFIHSPADEVIPYEQGRRLFEAASEPKQFYKVANAAHNDTYIVGGEASLDAIRRFVNSCRPTN